ncbi:hypothetical protein RB620_18320 [Paenibacillus sp. LHD-117]|uniref:hypothetical protein n=1 Tax=Paenibacillus sp. LHD-117 TaxID=3071412 RepID=UPI0027DFD64A|nr:hypothetical protein [Paenibacillus sp. LHD-117]MDQ6421385.1 hypothetical protein [Paenibacillus sp. LHD-117]
MEVSNQEQKRVRLKQFLKILSEDPSLAGWEKLQNAGSLADLLVYTGYYPRNDTIDMAKVVSLLLKKLGHEAGSEDMMEHVINGGTVEEFMNKWKVRASG